jgi:hypothetical protein
MDESSTDQDLETDVSESVAESSPAEQGGSMLDAVIAAIEPKDKETSPSSAPDSTKATDTQSTDGSTPEEVKPKVTDPDPDMSEAEINSLHHKTKKQIQKLIGQRKDLESSVSALRPKADQYDQIASHIRTTGLNSADLDNLFEIGTLMKKGDLFAARDKLLPYVQQILEATGGVLPKDLEAAVEAKELSLQHARELAEARSRNILNQHQNGVRQQSDAQEGHRQFLGGVVSAVNDWEQGKRRSDPDWSLKAPEIKAALELAIFKGARPNSVQEAVKMAEDALVTVDAKLKQFRPQPRAVRSISGMPQASTATGPPKSMLEAVMQSLDR